VPSVLLLHGIGSSAATWWRMRRDLGDLGLDAAAVNLPGHGGRMAPDGVRLADLVDAVRADLDARPVDLVVGHSLGAVVALELARAAPDLVGRVLLEDPPSLTGRSLRDIAGAVVAEARDARRDPAAFQARLLEEHPEWAVLDARFSAESRGMLDVAAADRLLDGARWDLRALVAACPAPVHLLAATPPGSTLADPDRGELLDTLEGRAVVVESGHVVHRDRPAVWLWTVLTALEDDD
jgi:pimeloyl-ACP methyl ester carboxylesterase